jgi:archaemetzincin
MSTVTQASASYSLFHPWSDRVPENDRCFYWISFLAISILTLGIVPMLYYLIEACCSSEPEQPVARSVATREISAEEEASWTPAIQRANAILQENLGMEKLDKPAQNSGWRSWGDRHGEKPISFVEFAQTHKTPPAKKPVVFQLIGDFSKDERRMLEMVMGYIRATHRTEVYLDNTTLPIQTFKNIQTRGNQYDAVGLIDAIELLKKGRDVHMFGFTSYDLYPSTENFNFVLGAGDHNKGHGIWSKARLDDKNPAVYLKRMMKITAHEYGHMRAILHCVEASCLMNGAMSVAEIDKSPLLLCSQDAAKVAWMSGITLKDYYTHLLNFFTQFNTTYKTKIDFSKEIDNLKLKIRGLEA